MVAPRRHARRTTQHGNSEPARRGVASLVLSRFDSLYEIIRIENLFYSVSASVFITGGIIDERRRDAAVTTNFKAPSMGSERQTKHVSRARFDKRIRFLRTARAKVKKFSWSELFPDTICIGNSLF